ncbi:MAG: tyrosine recombinase XerC, partial [Oscillospiraceae bacterium]|nr:tyrosine recombinase XerC [Oscillospiraceae bacterium]
MNSRILEDCPAILKEYLFYLETIKGRSPRTIEGYYNDLKMFFRFLMVRDRLKNISSDDFEKIKIENFDKDILRTVTLTDVYEFLNYTLSTRENNSTTRARKVSCLRSFFKYLTIKINFLSENPVQYLETPNIKKSLPKFLNLEESKELLTTDIDSADNLRDKCIITIFVNCGIRLSELVGINLQDIKEDNLKVTGKGNKERLIYLNENCKTAIDNYLTIRNTIVPKLESDKNALFLSRNGRRISARRVEQIVDERLKAAGLSGLGYSTHKLRHTFATLMYEYGNVDINILKEILGHVNLSTTEIYTH